MIPSAMLINVYGWQGEVHGLLEFQYRSGIGWQQWPVRRVTSIATDPGRIHSAFHNPEPCEPASTAVLAMILTCSLSVLRGALASG
mmetsp:Transcript_32612/g.60644  ORF Transcript_32612/g.60644 Transcript_32612/m.60644 type:complete len:86 (-) Transcript_32612:1196-1453(-)